jgi:hypothetical protein
MLRVFFFIFGLAATNGSLVLEASSGEAATDLFLFRHFLPRRGLGIIHNRDPEFEPPSKFPEVFFSRTCIRPAPPDPNHADPRNDD